MSVAIRASFRPQAVIGVERKRFLNFVTVHVSISEPGFRIRIYQFAIRIPQSKILLNGWPTPAAFPNSERQHRPGDPEPSSSSIPRSESNGVVAGHVLKSLHPPPSRHFDPIGTEFCEGGAGQPFVLERSFEFASQLQSSARDS